MRSLEEIYRLLPPDVATEIKFHSDMTGNLQSVLRRLYIPPVHGLINQHNAVYSFVEEFGGRIVIEALKRNLTPQEFAKLKREATQPSVDAGNGTTVAFRKPLPAGFEVSGSSFGNPGVHGTAYRPLINAPLTSHGSLENAGLNQHRPVSRTIRLLSTPNYSGPDRRLGRDRRRARAGRRVVVTPFFDNEQRHVERRVSERRGAGYGTNAMGITGNRRQDERRRKQTLILFPDRRGTRLDRRRRPRTDFDSDVD